jgi:hypothetical protein
LFISILVSRISFGHYLTVKDGHDNCGNGDFRHIKDIWDLFQPTPYNGTEHLATYHGEFGVSRARIQRTPKHLYGELLRIITAPKDDPIYKEEGRFDYKGVPDGYVFLPQLSV